MNPNTFYAETFVDALARAGLESVCIAPGSRSTPLTLAFATHDGIKTYTHLDERAAAFFALGVAMASDKPVAMVCTSGTAAANFFPAIIEANMSRVPLLVLTADRPHELRHSGANQTIDQVKMYGDHVLWSVDMALPEANPPEVAVRNLRTMAARALAMADGRMEFQRKGVVHLNFPFRKPLEPTESDDIVVSHGDPVHIPDAQLSEDAIPVSMVLWLRDVIEQHRHGVIVCGPRTPGGDFPDLIQSLAYQLGYVLLADPLSNVRYRKGRQSVVVGHYDVLLQADGALANPKTDGVVIIRFGDVPTSKALNTYLGNLPAVYRLHITTERHWADDAHQTTDMIFAEPMMFGEMLFSEVNPDVEISEWFAAVYNDNHALGQTIPDLLRETFFDGAVINRVVNALPDNARLFVGNSNPVRQLDQFVAETKINLAVYGSRGASGIDGQVSTALGVGAATREHIYAILGDITFYHDMNGLLAIRRNGVTATIIVINNNGGGIFERLPIREHEPYYTEYFTTPHGLTFEHAAALYGLEYAYADDFASLDGALDKYINADVSSIIEVKTDIKTDEARRKEIIEIVNQQIRQRRSDD